MIHYLQWLYFASNELVEATGVTITYTVEALTAHDFISESFGKAGTIFGSDEHEDAVYTVQRVEELFKEHFSKEASSPRNQHSLTVKALND